MASTRRKNKGQDRRLTQHEGPWKVHEQNGKIVAEYQEDKINPKHYKKKELRRSSTFEPGMVIDDDKVIHHNGQQYHKVLERLSAPVEVVDIIETFVPNSSHRAHALTYMLRAGEKLEPADTTQDAMIRDLQKAAWWLLREVEFLGGPPNPLNK
jgi:hypothetical protein